MAVVVRLDPIRCSLEASVMPLLDLSPGQFEGLMSGLSYRKAFKKQLNRECHEKKKNLVCRVECVMLELFSIQGLHLDHKAMKHYTLANVLCN